ncbi:MAG: hypothetical protein JO326_04395 [Acetobacteraceae bacterium]|nr:hypothetical protein [Acetobacteraceae bacterium]
MRSLVAAEPMGATSLLTVPFWPGAYAALHLRSPIWEIYPLLPRSDALQREEVEQLRLAAPRIALVANLRLDDSDGVLFQRTNSLIYDFIVRNYDRVRDDAYPDYEIFVARRSSASREPE